MLCEMNMHELMDSSCETNASQSALNIDEPVDEGMANERTVCP